MLGKIGGLWRDNETPVCCTQDLQIKISLQLIQVLVYIGSRAFQQVDRLGDVAAVFTQSQLEQLAFLFLHQSSHGSCPHVCGF